VGQCQCRVARRERATGRPLQRRPRAGAITPGQKAQIGLFGPQIVVSETLQARRCSCTRLKVMLIGRLNRKPRYCGSESDGARWAEVGLHAPCKDDARAGRHVHARRCTDARARRASAASHSPPLQPTANVHHSAATSLSFARTHSEQPLPSPPSAARMDDAGPSSLAAGADAAWLALRARTGRPMPFRVN
jgi:hypothetical protein